VDLSHKTAIPVSPTIQWFAPASCFGRIPVTGLWKHKWRPIMFVLVVDDFGVKYKGKEHVHHLFAALKENYDVTTDWQGELFVGMHLEWDYKQGHVTISMTGYIQKLLQQFQHSPPTKPEHLPHWA